MAKQTAEQAEAVEEWIRQLGAPQIVHESIRRKFKKLKLSAEEIRTDMQAKLNRITK